MRNFICFLVLVFIFGSVSAQTTLTVTDDVRVKNGSNIDDDTNLGVASNLTSYLRFDLTNLSGTISDAKLNLVLKDNRDNGTGLVKIYLCNGNDWSESITDVSSLPSFNVATDKVNITELSSFPTENDTYSWDLDVSKLNTGSAITLAITKEESNRIDFHSKGSNNDSPATLEISTGTVTPTCNDGIQNGDETGVDCGGSCAACPVTPTCNDGIQNGDETGVDCGGSCAACVTEEPIDSSLPSCPLAVSAAGQGFESMSAFEKWVCLETSNSIKYAAPETGTIIYKTDASGAVTELVPSTSSATSGVISLTSGDLVYTNNKPVHFMKSDRTSIVPLAAAGNQFGWEISRNNPMTVYFYGLCEDATISQYYNNPLDEVNDTPHNTIEVTAGGITTFEISSIGVHRFQSTKPIIAVYRGSSPDTDHELLSPVSDEIFWGDDDAPVYKNYFNQSGGPSVTSRNGYINLGDGVLGFVNTNGDGNGNDSYMGVPVNLCGDRYTVGHGLVGYQLTSKDAVNVTVSYWNGSSWSVHKTHVLAGNGQSIYEGSTQDGGSTLGAGSNLWKFEGTGTFHLRTNDESHDEYGVYGWRSDLVASFVETKNEDGNDNTGTVSSLWTAAGNDIYYSKGKVGIGTDTPQEELSVLGDLFIDNGASNSLKLSVIGNQDNGSNNADLMLQSYPGNGRTQIHIVPGGTSTAAFLNVRNNSSTTDYGLGRLGVRNSFAILSATTSGSPSNRVKNVAIELDPRDEETGELFQISTGGWLDNSVQEPNERILFHVQEDGKVGIGTTSPKGNFQIQGTNQRLIIASPTPNLERSARIEFWENIDHLDDYRKANFTLHYSGSLDALEFRGKDGNSFEKNLMTFKRSGNVGIGTTTPDAKLTVAGNIHAQKVRVTIDAGADFVFQEGYQPPSLKDVEAFVKKNQHLPGIASEAQMQTEGLDVGEFHIQLLQKIEEMTLYMIEQQKEIEALKQEVKQLKKKN